MKWAITLLVVLPLLSIGADKYCSPTGSDSTGDGSIGNPWFTFRHGVLTMAAGDTLNLRGGTYDWDGHQIAEFKTGVSSNNPTIIQSYPGEWAIYRPTDNSPPRVNGRSNIVFRNFEMDAYAQPFYAWKIDGGSSWITMSNVTFRGCHDGHGLLISPLAESSEMGALHITHCTFLTNGWGATTNDAPLHQIYIQNSSNVIEHCYIEGTMNIGGGTLGIHDFASGGCSNVYRYNYITNCSTGIGVLGNAQHDEQIYNNVIVGGYAWGISTYLATGVRIFNNTCYTNNAGINIESSTGCTVENNIAVGGYANNPGGIYIHNSTDTIVRNNLSYGCTVGGVRTFDYKEVNSVNTTTSGNLFGKTEAGLNDIYDAKFYNAAAGLVWILNGSSAQNTGLEQTLFTDDYTGLLRPKQNIWDIGAYEFNPNQPVQTRRHAMTSSL